MELLVLEIVFENFQEFLRIIYQLEVVLLNFFISEEMIINEIFIFEEKVCLDKDVVNNIEERSEGKECMGMKIEEKRELDENCIFDFNVLNDMFCLVEGNCEVEIYLVFLLGVENRLLF